ncbi:MAG: manganese efflux pump MntP family protein [Candidatus Methanomethylophilaceae archaeon]
MFIVDSVLLGIGLAMDAFSVSLANGLNEPDMGRKRELAISGTFAAFQGIMPMIGWFIVVTAVGALEVLGGFIPWIALILLVFIGTKMILGSRSDDGAEPVALGFAALMTQGIATSIDALSVGFTISDYDVLGAVLCSEIIAVVTLIICVAGLRLGRKFGTSIAGRANILGGVILIAIGVEIFVKGVFF